MHLPRPLWIGVAAVVLIVASVGLGTFVPYYRQQVALREIERLGGIMKIEPGGPEWLRQRLGNERMKVFDKIETIAFRPDIETLFTRVKNPRNWLEHGGAFLEPVLGTRHTIDDGSLACVKDLPNVNRLSLNYTNVGDAGMEHVCRLRNLTRLDLDGTDVSDASVPRLEELSSLKHLFLRDTRLTDAGIAELQRARPGLTIHR